MKKTISLLLALAMLLSLAVTAFADEEILIEKTQTAVDPTVVEEDATAATEAACAVAEEEVAEEVAVEESNTESVNAAATSGTCGENLTWSFDAGSGTLTISGKGEMTTYYRKYEAFSCDTPWFPLAVNIRNVVISKGVTTIGQCAFYGLENLVNVSIADSVTYIGSCAFMYCNSLEKIVLPNSITSTDDHVFWYCAKLKDVTLSEKLTSIARYMFKYCESLQELRIPASVTYVGEAFACENPNLVNVKFMGNAPSFHEKAFLTLFANVYYPVNDSTWTLSVMKDYAGNVTWTPYGQPAGKVVMGPCGENVTWEMNFATGTLTIRGNGDMEDYWQRADAYITPWFSYSESIRQVIFERGVTGVAINAFSRGYSHEPGYPNLTSIKLSDTIEDIGHSAFNCCWNLPSITIPASVKSIGCCVFDGCSQLKEIRFEGSAPEVVPFNEMSSLYNVTAIAYYPAGNKTWTGAVQRSFGGNITWLPYGNSNSLKNIPVYRFYNPYTNEHLLVSDEGEKNGLVKAGWTLEGVAWNAPKEGSPVYRLYNPDDWHTYTSSEEEMRAMVAAGWSLDGPVSCTADSKNGRPVYRLFNPYEKTNFHLFTAGTEERDMLVNAGWILEGVAWYAGK